MRSLIIAALLLGAGSGHVLAEVAVPTRPPGSSPLPASKATLKRENDQAITNCVQMWDRGTHMTKQQWLRTCQRVQGRLQNLQIPRMN
jgi:hypothetical protein